MKKILLGNTKLEITPIGMGVLPIGPNQRSLPVEDGARIIRYALERGINFIWVRQDLMDPRTISRREMRDQVNKYMQTVLQEEPVDASLMDFEDDLAW